MKAIKTKKEYYAAMARIEDFLEKGFANLTKAENLELKLLGSHVEAFEKIHYPMPVQHDLTMLLIAYMNENHLTKQQMAVLLEVDLSTLNNIMDKRKSLTLSFAKRLHQKIHLDGNLILEMAWHAKGYGTKSMDFFIVKGLKKITGSSLFTKHQKSENTMKVKYDKEVDILYIGLSEEKIKRERWRKPGVILDYDKHGAIVGIEILNASKRMKNPA